MNRTPSSSKGDDFSYRHHMKHIGMRKNADFLHSQYENCIADKDLQDLFCIDVKLLGCG